MKPILTFALTSILLTGACATDMGSRQGDSPAQQLFSHNVQAAQQLSRELKIAGNRNPVFFATAVDLDDLGSTSSFGRMISEQVSSGLVSSGTPVNEIRLRGDLLVSQKAAGEFILSREVEKLTEGQAATHAVYGTYTKMRESYSVTFKAVNLKTGVVVATSSYVANARGL